MDSTSGASVEIAIHGRGGQAAKTAGEVLTYTLYRKGFNPHGQPRYTPDRMGAPVSYAIRFHPDRALIYDRSWIRHPEIVLLFDLSLVEQLDLAPTWRAGITVVALATDGTGGPTDSAGGIADGGVAGRGRALGFDPEAYLRGHNAYPFLAATHDLLLTGPTQTNVNDLVFVFVGAPAH